MRNMLVQLIKKLKRQKQMRNNNDKSPQNDKSIHNSKPSPKRNAPNFDLAHRQVSSKDKPMFSGFTFCFPIVDKQITPKQIELLSESIQIQGGNVIQFKQKPLKQEIDFLLISPLAKPQVVQDMISTKINYKQMIDYNFITDSLKEGRLKNFQQYSLFVNIQEIPKHESQEKRPHKKVKRQSDNDTVRLSQGSEVNDKFQEKIEKMEIKQGKPMRSQEHQFDGQKQQMEQIMLTHKDIGQNKFSMNKFIAEQLTKLMKIYETERDIGRKIAYMKASAVIKSLDREIESERDVQNIKGIGKKISDKIKQLLTTGKMQKLQTLQKSEKNMILGQFCKIWGIGPSKAQQLYNSGISSIADLKKRTDLLTKNQKIGLKYHQQFEMKIPRQKVTRMFEYVKRVLQTLVTSLDMYRLQVCGSYRREKAYCGDMDIIISRKDGVYQKSLLQDLVRQLQNTGFLTDHLTHPKVTDVRSSISYMGVCKFQEDIHHRIDIKYYPIQEFAYAILYFTGSGMFNRMMRLHCMKLGLNLSDHGATPKMQKGVIWRKPIPTCYTEQDIFKYLDLEYRTPKQRQM